MASRESIVGQTLGHYRVIEQIGAGGMGVVFRARDQRLEREVALKVLPPGTLADETARHRFHKEALSLSRLNHPNIATVHDFDTHEGVDYLVTEFILGTTLDEKLQTGPLPEKAVIKIGIQLADGLQAAHQQGVIHRDLKPGNLKLTPDDRLKILDFGLALRVDPAAELSATQTILQPGLAGTLAYMAPEQLQGEKLDARTDIWAAGAVLFELATARRAFQGKTAAALLDEILHSPPVPPQQLQPRLSARLADIILKCLEKEPDNRYQSAKELMVDLRRLEMPSSAAAPPLRTPSRWRRAAKPARHLAAALVILAAFLVGYSWKRRAGAPPAPTARPPVLLQRLTEFVGTEQSPAVSPDGKSVALSAGQGTPHIWVRLLAGGPPLKITRDEVPHLYPRWAPDSATLIYFSPAAESEVEGAIYEIPALGGTARRLASSFTGADISHDGKRLAFFHRSAGHVELIVADRNGNNPRLLASLASDYGYCCPRWSPDDRLIGYQRGRVFNYDVFAVADSGGEPKQITHDYKLLAGFSWLPDSSGIVYSSSRLTTALYLPTMDLFVARLDGSPAQQLTFGDSSYLDPDVDSKGRVFAAQVRRDINIWKFPIDGTPADNARRAVQITQQTGHVQTPSVSPDEREMVYLSEAGGHSNLWVMKLDGSGEVRQITFEQDPQIAVGVPVWSPDGRYITFFTRRPQTRAGDQWLVNPDGSNLRRLVNEGGWAAWSPDGKWLYVSPQGGEGEPYRIMKVPVDGGQPIQVRDDSSFIGSAPAPDGKTLYFLRMGSRVAGGQDAEIHVATPEGARSRVLARIPARRWPVSYLVQPVVSHDGKWLALMLADGFTTNIYLLSTRGGPLRQITNFGNAATDIARRVSWSADSRHIYAAVARSDADVVVLSNLLQH